MKGRGFQVLDQLISWWLEPDCKYRARYVLRLLETLQVAHDVLRNQQQELQTHETQDPPVFQIGGKVRLHNKMTNSTKSVTPLPKFVGPFTNER